MSDNLMNRARALGLHGLIAHWDEVAESDWLTTLIAWEEEERRARSLKRRLADARLGEFKPLADFNWDWPRSCDRMAVEDLLSLDFLNEATNVVLVGPNGVGKSTIAANIAHRAVLEGHTVRFATAASMLGELAALDSDTLLQRKLRFYARQHLLVIDEVGYLSYSNRHADLLFNIVSSRSQQRSTIITTNRPFAEWGEAFPNAACLVALVDRLVHNAEIIAIDGDSYRRKEAEERQKQRSAERRRRREAKARRRSGKGGTEDEGDA
ncbi:MAG: IS21-like element helper ATPase IstB [Chloroflexota bacterium]|nr:IS21-like element helper ATPase IstB [Chloroflexota bacterium]